MSDSDLVVEGLAPVWVRALILRGAGTQQALALWRDRHSEPPTPQHEHLLGRWADGTARITDLARELGLTHSRVQDRLTETALRLIAPHLEDLPRWARARSVSVSDGDIAALSGTSPQVVALALDGWPDAAAPGDCRGSEVAGRGGDLLYLRHPTGEPAGRAVADLVSNPSHRT